MKKDKLDNATLGKMLKDAFGNCGWTAREFAENARKIIINHDIETVNKSLEEFAKKQKAELRLFVVVK